MRQSCCLLLLLGLPLLAAGAEPPSLNGTFPRGVYWAWERVDGLAKRNGLDKWAYVERCLDDLRAHHVDSVWAVNLGIPDLRPLADRLAARRMKLVPALGELHYNIDWRRNNWAYLEKESKRAIAAAGDSPAILAWALCDEPTKQIVGEMETFRRKFHEWGATQPTVVVTMWPDSPTFAEQTGFGAVCTDVYPFFAAGNPNGPNTPPVSRNWYRRHAQIAAQAAQKAGRTPWLMPQSFTDVWGPWRYDAKGEMVMLPGSILHWRVPTVGESRWQVWSAIGAGVRGFFWFLYSPSPTDSPTAKPYVGPAFPPSLAVKQEVPLGNSGALVRPDGSSTPQYTAVGEAFAALEPLQQLLAGAVPVEPPFGEVAAPGWLGGLHNAALKRTVSVLVNDDTERPQTLRVYLLKPHNLRDLRTGQVLQRGTDNAVTITLQPGDGTLLEAE